MSETVAILGAGAWGTALAAHLARASGAAAVKLWARDAGQSSVMEGSRENARYLPGVKLPPGVSVLSDLGRAVDGASLLVLATPIGALVDLVEKLRSNTDAPLVWVGKGFVATADAAGVTLAHQRIAPLWRSQVGVISGPSFAEEVARRLRGETFRAYVSDDLIGIEVGGAIKNVLAIAAGLSDGLGFGHNARAALITRGIAETARLSAALGGDPTTLMGLAGLGDLVLTCTGDLSRNRRVGLALAGGQTLPGILAALGHVAEGVAAARAATVLARHHGLEMPITEAVYRVLYEELPVRRAVETLLAREPKSESP